MKKTLFLFFTIIGLTLSAQQEAPPQGINYQAVVYSDNGNNQPGLNNPGQVLWNKDITLRFAVYQGEDNPILVYEELHAITTDEFGMVSLVIGQGVPQGTQLFETINWGTGPHFLRVDVDKNAGINFESMSYQKLWSVPYALYSEQSNSSNFSDSSDYSNIAGNGITGVTDNGDGTLTFTYFDGSSYTTPVLSGMEGPQGEIGPEGPAGIDGQDGLSAYEVWLSQGNTGTEADFLNGIIGPQGPAGTNGINGTNGTDGQNGQDGLSAYEVWLSQGNTGAEADFLNGIIGPQGPAGTNGVDGTDGIDGQDGLSAYEVWLSQGNTGTQADFLNGITGPQGPAGATGATGLTGPQGPQGIQGLAGATGATGMTGPQGPQGPASADGNGIASTTDNGDGTFTFTYDDGSTFTTSDLTGPQGATGATGPQGPVGATGVQGPQGPAGADGQGGVTTAGANVTISGTGTIGDPYVVNATDNVDDADNDPTNELQVLSLSNDTLYLSNGNSVFIGGSNSLVSGTNLGDMLYWDGNNWVNVDVGSNGMILTLCNNIPTWTANGSCPVQIGDTLGGGIVAYVLQPGDSGYDPYVPHGIISAMNDQGSGDMGCVSLTACSGYAYSQSDGEGNTNNWASCCGSGAPVVCFNLNLNGYSDWYLPAKQELNYLYAARFLIGNFTTNNYWCSTPSASTTGPTETWNKNFNTGGWASNYNQFNIRYIRAVRKF